MNGLRSVWVCDKYLYPNIHSMLEIAVMWPVTSCEYEPSFSGPRRLNTYLWATQTSERLDSLALIHIYRNHQYDMEEWINRFSRIHPKRIKELERSGSRKLSIIYGCPHQSYLFHVWNETTSTSQTTSQSRSLYFMTSANQLQSF